MQIRAELKVENGSMLDAMRCHAGYTLRLLEETKFGILCRRHYDCIFQFWATKGNFPSDN